MDERQNIFYDNYINDKINLRYKAFKINPYKKNKLSRYDSALFPNNFLEKNDIIKLKEKASIKNIEFSFPAKKIILNNKISRNITKIRLKHFYKSKSNPQFNKNIKLIKNNNMINSFKYIDFKNKNNEKSKAIYKPINPINLINKKIYDREKKIFARTFYCLKRKKTNNFINNYLNKFSETDKILKEREMIPLIESDRTELKDKLPINTLKHYHRYLFHNNGFCNCNEEEKGKTENRNYNHSQIYESSSQFNNNIDEYEIMELGGKKNYVATKLTKKKKEKHQNRSKSLITLNLKKKQDFHYIMKHPFSNSYFCSSFVNQLTDNNNNSYINNFSEKFQNLNNPLNDKDLTDKLHNLILNPNTSKIRNGELLLMYKKYPKGTFYNIYKNNQNNNNDNDLLYHEELKKLENTKYHKYIIKLNKTMEKAKNIKKLLDIFLYMNKKK